MGEAGAIFRFDPESDIIVDGGCHYWGCRILREDHLESVGEFVVLDRDVEGRIVPFLAAERTHRQSEQHSEKEFVSHETSMQLTL